MSPQGERFTFEVSGSVTGYDGTGTNQTRFTSTRTRCHDPADWNLGIAVNFSEACPPGYQATWRTVRQFRQELRPVNVAEPSGKFPIPSPSD